MMRNLIVLGCAALLAIGLSFTAYSGAPPDTDSDGSTDPNDNCVLVTNSVLLSTGSCNSQEDGDSDGYGNPCDHDVNNDGAAGLDDLNFTFLEQKSVGTDPNYDFNCDGATGLDDVVAVFQAQAAVLVPGPSGLACAGTVPCP